MKIVWIRMYDDSAANDIGYCKLWCNCGEQCHYLRKEVADHRRALGADNCWDCSESRHRQNDPPKFRCSVYLHEYENQKYAGRRKQLAESYIGKPHIV